MDSRILFQDMIKQYIVPVLKAAKFQKSKCIWNRSISSIVHVIDFQESQWNDSAEMSFTVNIGVFIPDIEKIVWDKALPKVISESECFPKFRIGYFPGIEKNYDMWWELHADKDFDLVGKEVANLIETKCLPVLDACNSIEEVLKLARLKGENVTPAEKISLAVLMYLVGQKESGMQILNSMENDAKLHPWYQRIQHVRCQLEKIKENY